MSVAGRIAARLRRSALRNERGQVIVVVALMVPVFFGLGAIVIDVGNWYVHKRHLQTQVDAAALAPGPQFVGCFHDPAAANQAIAQRALEYAGDTLRDPSTTNLQVQEEDDVRVVLNSDTYWNSGDPTDGSLHDYTQDREPSPNGDGLGDPCNEKAIDVKATDEDAPLLWGLIPISPSPKAKARVEIFKVEEHSGMLPWAVPEIDPRAVAALFVNEDNGQVFDFQMLEANDDPGLPWSEWRTQALQQQVVFDGPSNQNTGVVILVSKDDPTPQTTGTLAQICGQDPPLVRCYSGATQTSGLSFIHGYSGGFNGGLADPQVRDVRLFGCDSQPDFAGPYFTLVGGCTASVQMVVDFGMTGDPTVHPHCARIPGFTWVDGGLGGSRGTWEGSISLPTGGGRQTLNISGTSGPRNLSVCGNPGQQPNSFSRPKVAAPYVWNSAAGPVQYLKLTATHEDGVPVGDANSIETNSAGNPHYNYTVTVGLPRPLNTSNYDEDPVVLRMASPSGSQNQAYDCDSGVNFRDEIQQGCRTKYKVNYDDHDGDGDYEWRDITCAGYSTSNLPPATTEPDPPEDCVITETGDKTGQLRDGVTDRFGPPDCAPNNWPTNPAEAATFFGPGGYDFGSDPRYVTLIITDDTSFTTSGNTPLPIKYFAGFYVTGWDYHSSQSPGCPDNDPHPLYGTGYNHSLDDGDVWGYFVNVVVASGTGSPDEEHCAFGGDPSICISQLVE